jgi:hypothetical protein
VQPYGVTHLCSSCVIRLAPHRAPSFKAHRPREAKHKRRPDLTAFYEITQMHGVPTDKGGSMTTPSFQALVLDALQHSQLAGEAFLQELTVRPAELWSTGQPEIVWLI